MFNILRSVGVIAPFIFLYENENEKTKSLESILNLEIRFPLSHHTGLMKPYNSTTLCNAVYNSILTGEKLHKQLLLLKENVRTNTISNTSNNNNNIDLISIDMFELKDLLDFDSNLITI